jgi:hypothetical protein
LIFSGHVLTRKAKLGFALKLLFAKVLFDFLVKRSDWSITFPLSKLAIPISIMVICSEVSSTSAFFEEAVTSLSMAFKIS